VEVNFAFLIDEMSVSNVKNAIKRPDKTKIDTHESMFGGRYDDAFLLA